LTRVIQRAGIPVAAGCTVGNICVSTSAARIARIRRTGVAVIAADRRAARAQAGAVAAFARRAGVVVIAARAGRREGVLTASGRITAVDRAGISIVAVERRAAVTLATLTRFGTVADIAIRAGRPIRDVVVVALVIGLIAAISRAGIVVVAV
jgi:hypothetical protein